MIKKNGMSLLSLGIAATMGGTLSYLFFDAGAPAINAPAFAAHAPAKAASDCTYSFARVQGFDRVRPLLYSEPMCESPRFESMRGSISSAVDGMRSSGQLKSASVYVREFSKGEWTMYNGDEPYDPGSMLKIPLLLTYLAMAEEDPALLKRTWTCENVDFSVPQFTAFPATQVQLNVSYTVTQLLETMMLYSDNRATVMLLRHVPRGRYIQSFTDLGLPKPDWEAPSYRMNVRDYSVFMKALYNSSVLSPMHSEYALELMTRAVFKQGIVAGLPDGIDVAHKFGEAGTPEERQLHETGLVYADGHPYLITIMTRGGDEGSLASAIASLSKLVYESMREG